MDSFSACDERFNCAQRPHIPFNCAQRPHIPFRKAWIRRHTAPSTQNTFWIAIGGMPIFLMREQSADLQSERDVHLLNARDRLYRYCDCSEPFAPKGMPTLSPVPVLCHSEIATPCQPATIDMIALQVEAAPCGVQEHVINTSFGSMSVLVCGDQSKPPLITYPDVALNYMFCFEGFFACPEAMSLLCENLCMYHINAPGHELGASAIPPGHPLLTVDDMAEQVAEVLDYFKLQKVLCMGVTAGAYILTLFAIKYRERVAGLILVSPLCRTPSWREWFCNKLIANLLYFYGMCGVVKKVLMQRYFSQDLRMGITEELDLLQLCSRLMDKRHSQNVMRFVQAIHMRKDLTHGIKKLKCRTLVFVGDQSPFYEEALHINRAMDCRYNALVEVHACGSLVTEELPHSMVIPMEYFLMGYGFYRPNQSASHMSSYTNATSPCMSAELLSPESLGLKLKPIRTRAATDVVCD